MRREVEIRITFDPENQDELDGLLDLTGLLSKFSEVDYSIRETKSAVTVDEQGFITPQQRFSVSRPTITDEDIAR